LTFADPVGDASFGLIFDNGGLDDAVTHLKSLGCELLQRESCIATCVAPQEANHHNREEPGRVAVAAAGAVQEASVTATNAISVATHALRWGIRGATDYAKTSKLLEPTEKPLQVPAAAKSGVSAMQDVSKTLVSAGGAAISGAASLAGSVAGQVAAASAGSRLPASGCMADAKHVGSSSLRAGIDVCMAVSDAADQLVQEVFNSSSEVVGHKFGDEAGATSREGFQVVGNLMAARSLLNKKAVAKTFGQQAASSAAASAGFEGTSSTVPTCPIVAPMGSTSGIRLGPQ